MEIAETSVVTTSSFFEKLYMNFQCGVLFILILLVQYVFFASFLVLIVPSIFTYIFIIHSYLFAFKKDNLMIILLMGFSEFPLFVLFIVIIYQIIEGVFTKLMENLSFEKLTKYLNEKLDNNNIHKKNILFN